MVWRNFLFKTKTCSYFRRPVQNRYTRKAKWTLLSSSFVFFALSALTLTTFASATLYFLTFGSSTWTLLYYWPRDRPRRVNGIKLPGVTSFTTGNPSCIGIGNEREIINQFDQDIMEEDNTTELGFKLSAPLQKYCYKKYRPFSRQLPCFLWLIKVGAKYITYFWRFHFTQLGSAVEREIFGKHRLYYWHLFSPNKGP
jgi:hypothetical protein